jgi:hypothetical protein
MPLWTLGENADLSYTLISIVEIKLPDQLVREQAIRASREYLTTFAKIVQQVREVLADIQGPDELRRFGGESGVLAMTAESVLSETPFSEQNQGTCLAFCSLASVIRRDIADGTLAQAVKKETT